MTRINSTHPDNSNTERSLLASLRAVIPPRPLQFSESLRLAELQANRLISLSGTSDGLVPSEIVSDLPRVRVEYRDLPTSGMSYWAGQSWVICLNTAEPRTRQRFTLFHEFKHILDHGRTHQMYRGTGRSSGEAQAEQAADYFAGCVLVSKRFLKRAWGDGIQRPSLLACLFEVSPRAVDVRLAQLGLTEPRPRCAPAGRSYYRQSVGASADGDYRVYLRQAPSSMSVPSQLPQPLRAAA